MVEGALADARTQPGSVKTVADILTAAAALIEKPGAWTQGGFAFAPDGEDSRFGFDDSAVCWCALGALQKVEGRLLTSSHPAKRALEDLVGNVALWNDAEGRTQAEVVAALRQAAEKARQEVSS